MVYKAGYLKMFLRDALSSLSCYPASKSLTLDLKRENNLFDQIIQDDLFRLIANKILAINV